MDDLKRENGNTRTGLGKDVGLLAHELHNILTVLFGIVEELQRDAADVAARNAPLLQAGVEKTERVAAELFALRLRMIEDATVEPRSVADRLAGPLGIPVLADAFGDERIQGEPALVERLFLAVAVIAGRCGGLKSVIPLHVPDDAQPGRDLRFGLVFGEELAASDRELLRAAAEDLGGSARVESANVTCNLLAARTFA